MRAGQVIVTATKRHDRISLFFMLRGSTFVIIYAQIWETRFEALTTTTTKNARAGHKNVLK